MTACLIYHDVVPRAQRDDVGFPGRLAGRYKHTPEEFAAHLDAVASTGRPVGLWPGVGGADVVVLTFDDGGASVLRIAEALEARGWRGHFFITTGRIGTRGFAPASDLLELQARGHDVGSHTHTHPAYVGNLPRTEVEDEWTRSRGVLGDLLGAPPATAAVPGGHLGPHVVHAARAAGYATLMTSEPSIRHGRVDGLELVGRYSVWDSTPPATAAAYARGARLARARLWTEWRAKSAAKRLGPRGYDVLRRIRAGGA